MTAALLVFQALVWLGVCLLFIRSRTASVFHPLTFYLAFHGLVFVVRPILEHLYNFQEMFYVMHFYPSEDLINFTLILTSVSLLVYAAVAGLAAPAVPRFERALADGFSRREWQAYFVVLALLGPVALVSAALSVRNTVADAGAGVIEMIRDPITGVIGFANTTGYLVTAQGMIGALCLMLIWGCRFRAWSFIPLVAYLAERVYLGWERWAIVLTLASLMLLALLRQARRWPRFRHLALALPVLLIFQQLGERRETFQAWFTGDTVAEDVLQQNRSWIERQDTPDFANFDFLTFVVDVIPEKSGTYTYFTQYLQLFTEPVPRVLWPGKPYGSPIELVNLNDYGNFVGWTVSIVGDGWKSAGWVGVVIVLTAVGLITAYLHRSFWSGEASAFKVLAYCIFLPLTIQWYRDGGIVSVSKFVLWTIGPVLLWRAIAWLLPTGSANARWRLDAHAIDERR
jgi:hypothetical protein